jgi:Xaa-Pro aminopeptidase
MKSDLDRLMAERNLDGFLVMGDSDGNPVMNYLTGGAHLEGAMAVKRRGSPLTLIHGSMERDSVAASGLRLVDRDRTYNRYELLRKHEGDELAAAVEYYATVLHDQSLTGRIGVYGRYDLGAGYALLNRLQEAVTDVELVGEYGSSLFSEARETKGAQELRELREAGRRTCAVVGEVQAYIQEHRVRDETVLRPDGEPLTIGDVKLFMRTRLMAHGLVEDHDTIFSQGADAAVPHNTGNPARPLRLGQSIIFDIFPKLPSGYFSDITRTWSLGYATDDVQAAWDACKEIFDRIMAELAVGRPCREYQVMTLDYFEAGGHPTPRSDPGAHDGYVHSLGHGIGLDIHEEPRLSHAAGNDTVFQPGYAFSVEPGLYYADRGFGVRIEDSVAFDEDGALVWLTEYPYDLVLPMRRA